MRRQVWRGVFALAVIVLLLGVAVPVRATDTVPLNMSFIGNGSWGFWSDGAYDASVTETGDGGGSGRVGYWGSVSSSSVQVTTNSHLKFGGKANSNVTATVTVDDFTAGTTGTLCQVSLTSSWQDFDCALSGFAGHDVAVRFSGAGYDHNSWFDWVEITNATNMGTKAESSTNGTFYQGMWGWHVWDGWYAGWSNNTGHNGVGSLFSNSYNASNTLSRPIVISSASWGLYAMCSSGGNKVVQVNWWDFNSGSSWVGLLGSQSIACDSVWHNFTWNMSAYVGHTGEFDIHLEGYSQGIWVDDFCPSSGCYEGTPTPTPTLTPTPVTPGVYGQNTPLPVAMGTIDWSQFPTPAPYPTFPGFATPVYGAGTAQPVVINGGSPIPVYLVTPLATQLPYPTAIYGKDTPMPYINAATATPPFTPLPLVAAGGSMGDPNTVPNQPNFANPQSNSNLVFGSGSDTSSPVDIVIVQTDLVYSFSFLYPILPNSTWIIHYIYPSHFRFAGIDLMTGILGIGAVWFAVFLIRRLQKR